MKKMKKSILAAILAATMSMGMTTAASAEVRSVNLSATKYKGYTSGTGSVQMMTQKSNVNYSFLPYSFPTGVTSVYLYPSTGYTSFNKTVYSTSSSTVTFRVVGTAGYNTMEIYTKVYSSSTYEDDTLTALSNVHY